ncbi:MAG: hypothetical protein H6638_14390 [Ardenticatenales bacterium]|nr:hypothetical protein [Ardenticatenales bacterium]MCB9172763.1 hypothetical protein [Ardenticatenales bacterium]
MTKRGTLLVLMMVAMLLLAACGGSNTPATDSNEGAGDGDQAATTRAPKATTESSDDSTADDAAAEDSSTADESDGDEAMTDALGSADAFTTGQARSIDEVDEINSYRADINIKMGGEAFEDDEMMAMMADGIVMKLEVVKDPEAQHIEIDLGPMGTAGFIVIEGKAYSGLAGQWFETTPDDAPDVSELTAGLDADEMGDDLNKLEVVGDEKISGRDTVHYRGDKDVMAAIAAENSDDSEMSQLEEGQIDLWIDKEEGFIVRLIFEGSGTGLNEDAPELEGSISLEMDYYDFNEDITIEAPDNLASIEGLDDLGDDLGSMGGDMAEALGFELTDLPAGVTPDVFGSIVNFTLPDTDMAGATDYVKGQLEANGYTMNEGDSLVDVGLLIFEEGSDTISAFLTESGSDVDVMLTKD